MVDQTNKFNYQGYDSPDKLELFNLNLLRLEDELRNRYISRLELFNKDNLEHNPEPFRFFKKENCSPVVLLLPYEFNNLKLSEIYFLSTPNNRQEKLIILTEEDLSDLDSYQSDRLFFENKVFPKYGYDKTQIIFSTVDFYAGSNKDIGLFSDDFNLERFIKSMSLTDFIIRSIKEDTINFQEINQTQLSYFAQDAHKFPFSIIDLKPLISLVKDDDFTYQLDQAMAAYHENLFLPCAATLGVVLETLCIKILEDNGVKKIKSGDTQLGKLRERLINDRIITRRDNTRLEVAYKMRNMASHSSPGVALKEDCHFMLNVINTLAFDYLNADQ